MIIYGIDPGQNCGVSIWDEDRSISSMQASLIKAPTGDDVEIEDKVSFIVRKLCILMRDRRPDFVAIERPLRALPKGSKKRTVPMMGQTETVTAEAGSGGGAAAMISSNQIVGGIAGLCSIKDIPFITLASQTWRSRFYPKGFKPPVKEIKHRNGSVSYETDWKLPARERCALLRIAVTNHDMAEACGIAFAATAEQDFKKMKHQMERAA